MSGVSETRLHFVGDKQRAVFVENFFDALEVTLRRHDDTGVALNRFGNQRGGASRSRRLNNRFDSVRAGEVASRGVFAERTTVAVRIGREVNAADGIRIGAPHADTRQAHCKFRAPVQAALQRNELRTFGINRREQQRAFVGFGARRAEETFLQIARRDGGKAFGEVDEVFRQVNVADVLKCANLFNHAFGYERVAMPAINDGNARVAVEIFFARRVEKILHVAAHELRRVGVEVSEARHDVFAFLVDNFFRADIIQVNRSP